MKSMTLKPRVSEKAYGLSQANNVYVFTVPTSANKITVAQAVTSQFNVTVETVNMVVAKGKKVRTIRLGRSRARGSMGTRATVKKAYVTLKKGDNIAIFESDETKAKGTK